MTKPVEDIHMSVVARPQSDRVVWLEPTVKRVRAVFAGRTVVDSRRTVILFERGHLPVYYFPLGAVAQELLEPCRPAHDVPAQGRGELLVGPRRRSGRRGRRLALSRP